MGSIFSDDGGRGGLLPASYGLQKFLAVIPAGAVHDRIDGISRPNLNHPMWTDHSAIAVLVKDIELLPVVDKEAIMLAVLQMIVDYSGLHRGLF